MAPPLSWSVVAPWGAHSDPSSIERATRATAVRALVAATLASPASFSTADAAIAFRCCAAVISAAAVEDVPAVSAALHLALRRTAHCHFPPSAIANAAATLVPLVLGAPMTQRAAAAKLLALALRLVGIREVDTAAFHHDAALPKALPRLLQDLARQQPWAPRGVFEGKGAQEAKYDAVAALRVAALELLAVLHRRSAVPTAMVADVAAAAALTESGYKSRDFAVRRAATATAAGCLGRALLPWRASEGFSSGVVAGTVVKEAKRRRREAQQIALTGAVAAEETESDAVSLFSFSSSRRLPIAGFDSVEARRTFLVASITSAVTVQRRLQHPGLTTVLERPGKQELKQRYQQHAQARAERGEILLWDPATAMWTAQLHAVSLAAVPLALHVAVLPTSVGEAVGAAVAKAADMFGRLKAKAGAALEGTEPVAIPQSVPAAEGAVECALQALASCPLSIQCATQCFARSAATGPGALFAVSFAASAAVAPLLFAPLAVAPALLHAAGASPVATAALRSVAGDSAVDAQQGVAALLEQVAGAAAECGHAIGTGLLSVAVTDPVPRTQTVRSKAALVRLVAESLRRAAAVSTFVPAPPTDMPSPAARCAAVLSGATHKLVSAAASASGPLAGGVALQSLEAAVAAAAFVTVVGRDPPSLAQVPRAAAHLSCPVAAVLFVRCARAAAPALRPGAPASRRFARTVAVLLRPALRQGEWGREAQVAIATAACVCVEFGAESHVWECFTAALLEAVRDAEGTPCAAAITSSLRQLRGDSETETATLGEVAAQCREAEVGEGSGFVTRCRAAGTAPGAERLLCFV